MSLQAIQRDFNAAADAAVERANAKVVRWLLRERIKEALSHSALAMVIECPTHWRGIPFEKVTIEDLI